MSQRLRWGAGLVLVALVSAACGAAPSVERELEARRANGAGNGIGSPGPGGVIGSGETGSAAAPTRGTGSAAPAAGSTAGGGETLASAGGTSGGATLAPPPPAPEEGNGGSTDVGVTATSIKIGGLFFNGGFLDKYSQVSEQAAAAFFRFVNDQGGIYGRKIEFLSCDTQGTVNGTQGCLKKLGDQDEVFALGPSLDFNLDTVQGYLEQEQLPWVGSSGLYDKEFQSPWMYPTQLRGTDVGAMIATFSAQQLGVETVAVSWLTNGAGPGCLERVRALGPKLGYEVVEEASNGDTESDLTPQVVRIRAANPDAILFCNDPVNTIKFVQAEGRIGYEPPMGNVAGFVAADDVPKAMGAAGVGLYGFSSYDFYRSDTPGVQAFNQICRHYYPSNFPHFYTQAAYTGAKAIVAALEAAGPNVTRQSFIAALRSMRDFDSGMGLRFDFADLGAAPPSGIMLQADENLVWQPITDRFEGVLP